MTVSADDLLDTLYEGASPCPHARINHARGILSSGAFLPSPQAASLSQASIFQGGPVAALVRFSNSGADAAMADNDPKANPRGMALRLLVAGEPVLDVVGHSSDCFPARTPDEFLVFLRAVAAARQDPGWLEAYVREAPAARRFLSTLPATPASYVSQRYFPLHAVTLTDAFGHRRTGRFRFDPERLEPLDAAWSSKVSRDFLQADIRRRVLRDDCRMRLTFRFAGAGDDPSDISTPWPERGMEADLGEIRLDKVVEERGLVFDPARMPSGLEPFGDPMLALRREVYALSFARRGTA